MGLSAYLDYLHLRSDDFSDYILPSAVNEFKQSVNSRAFKSVLLSSSLGFLIIAIWIYAFISAKLVGPIGFLFFNSIMDIGLIFVVPMMIYQNMSSERSNGSFELMSITLTTPLKIVLGKWQTAIMQSLVFCSLIFPGMVYCYFFDGIAISVIFLSLILTILSSQFSVLFAIFLCSLGVLKINRLTSQLMSTLTNIFVLIVTIVCKVAMLFYDQFVNWIFSYSFIAPGLIFSRFLSQ